MEPKFEPKQHTPEEIAALEKSRTISDAGLLKDGAEYVIDPETGEKRLRVTEGQVEGIGWNGNRSEKEEKEYEDAKKDLANELAQSRLPRRW